MFFKSMVIKCWIYPYGLQVMVSTYGSFMHRTLGTCMYRNRLALASHLYACARGWRVRYAVVLGGRSLKSSKSLRSAVTTNI